MNVKQMRYHRPGWKYENDTEMWQVWGPGPIKHSVVDLETGEIVDEYDTGKVRDHWAAHWGQVCPYENCDCEYCDLDSDYEKGDSLDEVLLRCCGFTVEMQEKFKAAIGG